MFEYVLEDMSVMSDFQLHKLCFLYKVKFFVHLFLKIKIENINSNFSSQCLKGFELSNQDVLDSAKFTILSSLLEEKKQNVEIFFIFISKIKCLKNGSVVRAIAS